jgi:glucosamine 6-phosphate synthetase-like amidotransferase/phosphosugar isomerase protein
MYDDLKSMIRNLILRSSRRGEDATGIAIINSDRHYIYKLPTDAIDFTCKNEFSKILDKIGPETLAVLCHNRFATQGSNKNPLNNHPLLCGNIIGIHNGIINNKKEVFVNLKTKSKRDVDSEAIFAALDSFSIKNKINKAFELLEGSLAVAFIDIRDKDFAYLARNDSTGTPCTWIKMGDIGVYVFASEAEFIEKSLESIRWQGTPHVLNENKLMKIDLKTGVQELSDIKTKEIVYAAYNYKYKDYYVGRFREYDGVLTDLISDKISAFTKKKCNIYRYDGMILIDTGMKLSFMTRKYFGIYYYILKEKKDIAKNAVKILNEISRALDIDKHWDVESIRKDIIKQENLSNEKNVNDLPKYSGYEGWA